MRISQFKLPSDSSSRKRHQASACRTIKGLVKVGIPGRLNANNRRCQNVMTIGTHLSESKSESESIDLKKRRAGVRVKYTLLHLHCEIKELYTCNMNPHTCTCIAPQGLTNNQVPTKDPSGSFASTYD